MIFKDRVEAGDKLAEFILHKRVLYDRTTVVISLVRGGVIIGNQLANKLKIKHLPLVVTKIPAPFNPELAIGAYCFGVTYLIPEVVNALGVDQPIIHKQILKAQEKFTDYINKYNLKEPVYNRLKNKTVIITDDGIATGASIKTALLFVKTKGPKKIFLAAPVASSDFNKQGFDKTYILETDPSFSAVSQYYENFPPVEDKEVQRLIRR